MLVTLGYAGVAGVTGELAWMLAFDSSLYLDILLAVWTASALRGGRIAMSSVHRRLTVAADPERTARKRAPRVHPLRPAPANDEAEERYAA